MISDIMIIIFVIVILPLNEMMIIAVEGGNVRDHL